VRDVLLSRQQKFMLDVLECLGCVREEQLVALVKTAFCAERPDVAPGLVSSAMRQMQCRNIDVKKEDGVYCLSGHQPDAQLLEAVDIMLQLSGGAPLSFRRDRVPVLLRFSVQDRKIRCFSVAAYSEELRHMEFPPLERIILLFDGPGRPRTLPVPNKQFIAVRQSDGSHRFFARDGQ